VTQGPPLRRKRTFIGAYAEGASAPFEGLSFMFQHPRLWRYAVIPILLNLLITVVVLVGLVYAAYTMSGYINRAIPAAWYYWMVKAILILLALVLALILSAVAFLILQVALCCFFYDRLARQVEFRLGMKPEDIREVPFYYPAFYALRDLMAMLVVTVLSLFLHLVPLIGSIASLCVTFYFAAFTFGVEYIDYPMALRATTRKEKIRFARANRPYTLGLGTIVSFFNFIPLLGSVILTTAVVGAVLLHRRLGGEAVLVRK